MGPGDYGHILGGRERIFLTCLGPEYWQTVPHKGKPSNFFLGHSCVIFHDVLWNF